ncbi:trypsin-like peptidase domain-containing protein [Mycobacterium nebraskense]|uniref:Trypsin n=1 Tax=Mycobacterium nebraskense TaxID=244292 RepID=A0A0F5NCH6_9MYCO|nr:trypsin-like peptidase domain-containing protein [Mycobacterium nebraskense]KKC04719.1 trypsin [Mycobacterium nebraskense]KLO39663.1 trypsin [Mycobacterium nebraskense]MBI2695397.1 trypsin-like peptidase domain-containing protein [Mycobacterium nebraskense]MCV7121377.1 trypsin-like peptidase domain-containing protein [Mycobacterium nebraskense]ORW30284.1 trypsin [Mycobacterium nebraskense]
MVALSAVALMLWAGAPGMAAADSGRPQAKPEERAAALIRPSIMYLAGEGYGLVRLPNGEVLSQFGRGSSMPFLATWNCTAFVVNPDGWVATAGHCVDPASATLLILKRAAMEYQNEFPDAPESSDPATTLEWLQKNARVEGDTPGQGPHVGIALMSGTGTKLTDKVTANVVDFRPLGKGDAALLKVAKRNLPSSELATDADVAIGTPILAVGFPESTQNVTGPSLDPTYKSGKVSKKSVAGSNPAYEIDAAMTEGMSGGPTIGLNGKVVGLNSFAPAGESQPFNFIAPADGIAAILASKGVKPMLGPADRFYRKGLTDFYGGHYTDAINEFDQTLAMSPGYPGLDDLKTNAANLRQQYGDASLLSGMNLLWYIVISVVSVIGLGAGLTFLGLKVRRPLQPAPDVQPLRLMPKQESGADEPHFCAHCGAEHHPTERFCPNCGKHIDLPAPVRGTGLIS